MSQRIARYMLNNTDQPSSKYNCHHIIGQCNRDLYNIFREENMMSVSRSQHKGYNYFVGNERQNPRGLFETAYERTHPVLTDYAQTLLRTLVEMPDDQLYIPEMIKNKKKPG